MAGPAPTLGLLAVLVVCGKGGQDSLPGGLLCPPLLGALPTIIPNSHSHSALSNPRYPILKERLALLCSALLCQGWPSKTTAKLPSQVQ